MSLSDCDSSRDEACIASLGWIASDSQESFLESLYLRIDSIGRDCALRGGEET